MTVLYFYSVSLPYVVYFCSLYKEAGIPSNEPEPRQGVIERVNRVKGDFGVGLCGGVIHEAHILQSIPRK